MSCNNSNSNDKFIAKNEEQELIVANRKQSYVYLNDKIEK